MPEKVLATYNAIADFKVNSHREAYEILKDFN